MRRLPEPTCRRRNAEDDADDGALAYTSYCVDGYITPRIWTDEVSTWETTIAVVAVGGGAAVSAANCCGDFTKEAPISPPAASKAAARPRRAARGGAGRAGILAPPACAAVVVAARVAGEPSRVTRSSDASRAAGPQMKLEDAWSGTSHTLSCGRQACA